jgi:hypothetical protein
VQNDVAAVFSNFCLATQGLAQEKSTGGKVEEGYKETHHGKSADEVAKELANPNNSLATRPVRAEMDYRV